MSSPASPTCRCPGSPSSSPGTGLQSPSRQKRRNRGPRRRVTLHLMAGSKEDAETVTAFFQDMRARGLGDPLLVVSDGAPGVIKAIETCFPRSARQRCLAHRMRNLAAKVPEDCWPEFKARATAAYQAPSRAIARDLAAGLVKDYEAELPSA
ncbi:MAG TPA: transposase, partial [Thermoanaerobaculia bacterium]|nr:transposase [Thermoanaerobaculia bacterium]